MSSELNVRFVSNKTLDQLKQDLVRSAGNRYVQTQVLMNYLQAAMAGAVEVGISVDVDPVKASGTATFVAADVGDTITIQGVTFTGVASGASSSQFNVGVKAALTNQNLTYTAVSRGSVGNSVTVALTAGGTAGSEVVTVLGNAISVQIESGVSSADQIKTAVQASIPASALVAVTGSSASASTTVVATALTGGVGSDTITAASIASAVNANSTLDGLVDATSSSNVLTLTADNYGEDGNVITIAKVGSGITLSGAVLAGGTNATVRSNNFGI